MMAELHVDESAIKGVFRPSFPNGSAFHVPGSGPNFSGMERYPNNLSCPSCPCLAFFTSDFQLFDDPITSTGTCDSPSTTLQTKEAIFKGEMERLYQSRSDQKRQSSRLRTVPTSPRESKKLYFCQYKGCSRASRDGFLSRSVRDRHQAIHNPKIPCAWERCSRLFSRIDSMKRHLRRMHQDRSTPAKLFPSSCLASQQMPLMSTEQSTHT